MKFIPHVVFGVAEARIFEAGFNGTRIPFNGEHAEISADLRAHGVEDEDRAMRVARALSDRSESNGPQVNRALALLDGIVRACEADLLRDFGTEGQTRAIHEARTVQRDAARVARDLVAVAVAKVSSMSVIVGEFDDDEAHEPVSAGAE